MFARSLEQILRSLLSKGDFSYPPPDEMEDRFHALRGVNLLPQGRALRSEPLTLDHVAHAVLGLATILPAHSGFAAITLGKLVPVGSDDASFQGGETLHACVVVLLSSELARKQLLRLPLSVGEGGVNSHGYAELLYEHPEQGLSRVYFVSTLATSKTGRGGETHIKTGYRYALASRELTLNGRFFDELVREIERHKALKAPLGDGSEYDAIEAREAEYKRLGVRRRSQYLHIDVDAHVTWPMRSTTAQFGEYQLVLMPRTAEYAASVHIDLYHHRLSPEEGRTVIDRFLSQLAWQGDHYAIAQDGWSGNPIPVQVRKRELAATVSPQWWFDPTALEHPDAERALALYREGLNAQHSFLVGYGVLSFYKVAEIASGGGKNSTKNWIKAAYLQVRSERKNDESFDRFEALVAQWNAPTPRAQSAEEY